jgi:ABC-type multidrug transport system fused ATPase/permease subunit
LNLLWASVIVVVVAACAIAAMLLVRRRAPDGSYFADGDRAAGVFGVLATGFAILAGFVVVLAFQSYDTSRSGAETEARVVAHQFETVQFMPAAARARLSGELVCYARSVVRDEWPRMKAGTLGFGPNRWGVELFNSLKAIDPRSFSEQTAYTNYLDERSDREDARADRTHSSQGIIPVPLWIVLFLSASTLFAFMLFFADSGEGWVVQSTMMGAVAVLVTSLLLLLWFLDNPYRGSVGSLEPVAMQNTLDLMQRENVLAGHVQAPCDAAGLPRR